MKINFNTKCFGKSFIWLDSVKSTNDFVAQNMKMLDNHTVVATLNQTSGKGTKKRKFHSVVHKTLAVSFCLKKTPTYLLPHLPKVCAVSLIFTLKKLQIKGCKIKWFNDITIDNKKIAGILCESSIIDNMADAIIGVGINILANKKELEDLGLFNAASIFSKTNKIVAPKLFLKNFVEIFEETYFKFMFKTNQKKILKLHKIFEQNCSTIGKIVKIFNIKTGEIFFAKTIKILLNGKLLVASNNKLLPISWEKYSIIPV